MPDAVIKAAAIEAAAIGAVAVLTDPAVHQLNEGMH